MKKLTSLIFLSLIFAYVVTAQKNTRATEISIYGGIQNPIEVALLDFNGSGAADVFRSGFSAGAAIERSGKFFGIKLSSEYLNNGLKSIDWYQYKGNLLTSYNKGQMTFRLTSSDNPTSLKFGLGAGFLIQRVPEIFIMYDFVTDDGLTEQTFGAENTFTISLCSSLNYTYPINEHWNIMAQVVLDGVTYYGDIESALLFNTNIGMTYRL